MLQARPADGAGACCRAHQSGHAVLQPPGPQSGRKALPRRRRCGPALRAGVLRPWQRARRNRTHAGGDQLLQDGDNARAHLRRRALQPGARLRKIAPAALCPQALEGLRAPRHRWAMGRACQGADRAHPRDREAASGLPALTPTAYRGTRGFHGFHLKRRTFWLLATVLCAGLFLWHARAEKNIAVPGAEEIVFHSHSLDRDMSYWVVLPEGYHE